MDRLVVIRRTSFLAVRTRAVAIAFGAVFGAVGCSLPFGSPPPPVATESAGEPLLKPALPAVVGATVPGLEPPETLASKAVTVHERDLVAQLKELDHLDAESKARVAADLRQVDQAFWPYVLLYYRDKSGGAALASDEVATLERLPSDRGAPRKAVRSHNVGGPKGRQRAEDRGELPLPAPPNQAAQLADATPPAVAAHALLQQPSSTFGQLQAAHLAALAQSSAPLPTEGASGEPLGWREHLQAAIGQLERQAPLAGAQAAGVEPRLRLLYLAADRGQEALEPCAGLSEGEQQFWSEELFGLSAALDPSVAPAARRHTLAARHLRQAAVQLGQQGLLDVRNAAFCSQVDSYGIYKRVSAGADELQAGQEVLLYAEVENFLSKTQPEGFHTSLASRYEIADEQGEIVARQDFPPLEETCRNQRRDFFIQHRMWIPKTLPRGRYRLRLVLTDNHGQKQGEAHLPFAIRGE
jgi:hypothetical protein